ncbi:hypothetical protein DMP15_13155 [Pseudonocardia sp. UM4_GMWB1]
MVESWDRCYQHQTAWSWGVGWYRTRQAERRRQRAAMARIPRPRGPVPAGRLTERQKAEIARSVLTVGWQRTVADQLATALNDDVWRSAPRWRVGRVDCSALADLADQVDDAKNAVHDAVGTVAARAAKRLGRGSLEREILAAFARRIPLPGDEQADAVVHGLRVTGVFVCLVGNGDVLSCPCFRALAKDRTKEELTELLERRLDEIVAEYRTRWQQP